MANANATETQNQDDTLDEISLDGIDLDALSEDEKATILRAQELSNSKPKTEDEQKVQAVAQELNRQGEQESAGAMTSAFLDALPKEQQDAARAKAPKILDSFIKNQNLIAVFGQSAVENVNNVVNRMLAEQKDLKVPEVDDLLEKAYDDVKGFVTKYNSDIELDKKENKLVTWFRKRKNKVDDWNFKRKDVLAKLDILDAKMITKREEMKRSGQLLQSLLNENHESANAMVGFLAVMEAVYQESVHRAAQTQKMLENVPENSPDYSNISEQLATLAEVTNAIDQQHANYMARLAIAWATNSQVRNLQRTQSSVIRGITQVHIHTIPTLKLSISQIGVISQTKNAANAAGAIKNASDSATEMLMKLQTNDLPEIMAKAEQPIVSADTINKLADSVKESNEKMVEAIRNSKKARRDLEQAVQSAGETIKKADRIRDRELVDALLNEKAENARVNEEFNKSISESYKAPKLDGLDM